jgi:hypothetical protein
MAKKSEDKPYHAVAYPMPLGFNGKLGSTYRWFSGRPLNGHRYTDATGFRYGTMATDLSGRATGYQLLPGYKRFLYVRFPIMVSPAAAVAFLTEPQQTGVAALGLATLGVKKLDDYRRVRRYRRQVVEPVAAGLSGVMRQAHVAGRGYQWLHVPADFRDNPEAKITATLPVSWLAEEGDKKRLTEVVTSRLNLSEASASFKWTSGVHTVSWSVPPKPPALVEFSDALGLLIGLDDESIALGMGPRGVRVEMSLKGDSPHALLAAGSGAGKSELLAYVIGQFMRRGAGVLVLDAKYISHMWLRSVPGVAYASEDEDMHNALLWLDREVASRARFVSMGGDPDSLEPLVAILEEMSSARNRLDTYWKRTRPTGSPALSPAMSAMANVANMGREVRVHIFMAGQSLTAKVTGGPEGRESYSARMLARATSNQWKMLAPQIKPAPTKRQAPGRWHIVVGDTLTEFQAPYMDLKGESLPGGRDEATARLIRWATAGPDRFDVAAALEDFRQDHVFLEGGGGGTEPGTNSQAEDGPPPAGISLRQYAEEAGIELKTLNRWRERRSDFPSWVAMGARGVHLFERDHLRQYVAGRLREPVGADAEE